MKLFPGEGVKLPQKNAPGLRLDVILDNYGVGADRLQRARHDPTPVSAATNSSCSALHSGA